MTTRKSIGTEIWQIKGEKVFSGKDTLIFVNRLTGKTEEYEMVKSLIHEEVKIQHDGTSEVDTDEIYGCNGYKRARWIEEKIDEQTNEVDN